jgi:hypothetical protein
MLIIFLRNRSFEGRFDSRSAQLVEIFKKRILHEFLKASIRYLFTLIFTHNFFFYLIVWRNYFGLLNNSSFFLFFQISDYLIEFIILLLFFFTLPLHLFLLAQSNLLMFLRRLGGFRHLYFLSLMDTFTQLSQNVTALSEFALIVFLRRGRNRYF